MPQPQPVPRAAASFGQEPKEWGGDTLPARTRPPPRGPRSPEAHTRQAASGLGTGTGGWVGTPGPGADGSPSQG